MILFPGLASIVWQSRKFQALIRCVGLLDKWLRHGLFVPVRNNRDFLPPGLALAKIHGLRPLRIPGSAARLPLARLGLSLVAVFLQAPGTELL